MAAFVAAPAAAAAGLTAARGGAFTAAARPATAAAAAAPARRAVVRMYGPPASAGSSTERSTKLTDPERRPGSLKGFVNEMRMVAMKLHTKDQAKEGMQEKSTIPINEWKPKQSDFVQFLADSLHVYEYFEEDLMVADSPHPEYARFANNGLERCAALKTDLAYLASLGNPTPSPTSAATKYVDYLKTLESKPEAVICHWYNYYFAHTAGGRMIGRMMQNLLFEGRELAFYMWEEDVSDILNRVRGIIDEVAADWPRDVKDECLEETGLSFAYSGTVLSNLAKAG
ncbi:hypothetical protein BU14_0176s0043 [Porphyra umbilicalis]|uniref:Uncharacterized protein n=1 Tax=Porphyra umbilicalis TaxID=2786 RepID=A0A1X6P7D9_PORUM|nr:hypothetical protein BU14_0176s0043 [Porphyra umbilicalis]|eukprot:OSX76801.1 hypothetical protein BU14_0176s0043 [Porphyra umbilicalis]